MAQKGDRLVERLRDALPAPARGLVGGIPAPVKQFLRGIASSSVLSSVDTRLEADKQANLKKEKRTITREQLRADLDALAIAPGSVVFIHSALSTIGFVEGGPATVVDEVIGRFVTRGGGTVAFPTFSLNGSMHNTMITNTTFDVHTSKSSVGAISENFRKRPGVVRSIHPTHSVAALGPRADWLVAEHHTCGTTFGKGSPLAKLIDCDGVIVGLGTNMGPLTFYHVIEDLYTPFPINVYTADSPLTVACTGPDGTVHYPPVYTHNSAELHTRIDREGSSWLRDQFRQRFTAHANMQWGRVGDAETYFVPVPALYAEMVRMVEEGLTIYTPAPDAEGDAVSTPSTARRWAVQARDRVREATRPARARKARASDRNDLLPPDPGGDATIDAGTSWLLRAQQHSRTSDGGVARHFSLIDGWGPSYPETTGYIIPTLLDPYVLGRHPEAEAGAKRMLDWLLAIQHEDGGFPGGTIDRTNPSVTFNTGQILMGLAAGAHLWGEPYAQSARRAGAFLLAAQDPDGAWRRHLTPNASQGPKTYETHTAWGLLEASRALQDDTLRKAAIANVFWSLKHQQPNGWFARCCLSDPSQPLTHTLGYTLRGVVEAWRFTGDERFLQAAVRTADMLAAAVTPEGRLPGRIRADGTGAVPWVCLTGSSQVASSWFLLSKAEPRFIEPAQRTLAFVRRTLALSHADLDIRGAVKGSFPVDGGYTPYEYPNWATKFTIDACLHERDALAKV